MLRTLLEEKEITSIMFFLMVAAIFLKILLAGLYNAMIKESDNMATTENKLLRQCKMKFANCYQLGGGVPNISVFVDKFITRLTLGPVSFDKLYHFSGQAMLLSVVFAGIGVCKGIVIGKNLGQVLPFYLCSFWGLYLYFSVSSGVDINSKKRILKINLIDYLENHFSVRMDVTMDHMEKLYKDKNVKKTVELLPIDGRIEPTVLKTSEGKPDTPSDVTITKEELEALLEEFLAVES